MLKDRPSVAPAGPPPALHVQRVFSWGELFVLIPMHAFWMLIRSTPFVAENTASAWVAALPILLLVLFGLIAQFSRLRAAAIHAEWLFHLTAAAGMFVLLVYVTVRDPFNPGIPITWPLCFWSIVMGFAALANTAAHERIRAQTGLDARAPWVPGTVIAIAAWAVMIGLASGMAWAPYFWTASLIFHAVMAVCSRKASAPAAVPVNRLQSTAALFESLFLVAFMTAILLRAIFALPMIGRFELKYLEFVNLGARPAFFAGAVLALLAGRFRFAFLTHAIVALVVLTAARTASWPIALAVGYGLPALFQSVTRQGSLARALVYPGVVAMWLLGMLGFSLAGLIVEYNMGLDFATSLMTNLRNAALALYIIWLALAGVHFWRSRKDAPNDGAVDVPPAEESAGGIPIYAAAWAAVGLFTLYVLTTAMWPPVWFERAERIAIGEPTGVCHAGYSTSDEEYANLHKLGVRMMRIDFHWDRIQPAPDTWNFSRYDDYVDAAEEHGIHVIGLLVYDNSAVETDPVGSKRGKYIAPADLPLYLEYVRRTVDRYRGRVFAWELWNEPDIPRFWDGPLEEVYELIRQSAITARETDPEVILLGPAMTSGLGVHSAEGIEHLHAIGALDPVDHPTMHAYVSEPRTYYNEFLRHQNAAAKYGHPGAIWITELGDPDGGVYPWRGSREHLAVHVIKAYTIATSLGIENLVWYCYRDATPERLLRNPKDSEGFFGLTNHDETWKPAAHAYSLFSHHCRNSEIRADLVKLRGGLAARQLRTALYRRANGESALILWFEPGLRPAAHARVTIDLGPLQEPATMYGITDGDTKPLLDDIVDITETPTFITFSAQNPETPVRLDVSTAPSDAAWLLLSLVVVLAAGYAALRKRPA